MRWEMLDTNEIPLMSQTTTIQHVIDEKSPMYGLEEDYFDQLIEEGREKEF